MREDEQLAKIPVIFVTAESDLHSEEDGLDLGAVDYLLKPYRPSIIHRKVRNHIELKVLRDDLEVAVAVRTRELTATHSAIIMGMSLLSESRDQVTGAHLARIQQLTALLAAHLRKIHPNLLRPQDVDDITTYSPLHDVGKVSVPDAVLKKEGKLTDEEFVQMKAHSTAGGDLLREISAFLPENRRHGLQTAIEIAECHHERYDGSGYPRRLKGEEIPLSARIVSVVDVYDALRSPRPYKQGFSHEETMDIITNGDGRTSPAHFDPDVLAAFITIQKELRVAYDANPDPTT
jgi:putative two-component system response regulator